MHLLEIFAHFFLLSPLRSTLFGAQAAKSGPMTDPDGREVGSGYDPDGREVGSGYDPNGYEVGSGQDPNGQP